MVIRSKLGSALVIAFAAVGVIATLALLGMAGMHLGMGGMMGSGMVGMRRNMMGG
jgi:hypothetical protein